MTPKLKLALASIVLVAGTVGFLLWNGARQRSKLIASSLPEIPAEAITHDELKTRIQNSTQQASEGPDQLQGLQKLSRLYHANGYTNEAWQCYRALLAVERDEAKWPYLLATILSGYGQLEEAAPLFKKAVDLDRSYIPARIRLADTLLKQNLIDEAAAIYRETLEQDSDNPYARVGLARVAIAKDDWTTARTELEKAVTQTQFQIGADLLGDVYKHLGLESKERIVLQNIRWGSYADIPDPWSLSLMDECYDAYQVSLAGGWVIHQGDVQTGLRYVRRAAKLDPNSPTIQYQLAGTLLKTGKAAEAEKHFRRSIELQPNFADAWLGLIGIARENEGPTAVRRAVDAALKACPDSPSIQIEKGKLLLSQNRLEQALPYFKRSIELRPYEAVGYIELAKAYLAVERLPEAMEQMREALRLEPNHPVALSTMLFDAIVKRDKELADYWVRELEKQPRLSIQEIGQLENMYQKAFGVPPGA